MNDAYQDFFGSCMAIAANAANPPINWAFMKLCGASGGEAYGGY